MGSDKIILGSRPENDSSIETKTQATGQLKYKTGTF